MNFKEKYHAIVAILRGKNSEATPKSVIQSQMAERRPLPIGSAEFDEWANRIISGAMVNNDVDSQKFALATMIMHLGPTESHKEDAFFIHSLRKAACNEVAAAKMKELKDARLAKAKAEEEAKQAAAQAQAAASVMPAAEDTLQRIEEMKKQQGEVTQDASSDAKSVTDEVLGN